MVWRSMLKFSVLAVAYLLQQGFATTNTSFRTTSQSGVWYRSHTAKKLIERDLEIKPQPQLA